jgi:Protein kinase domain
MQRFLSRKLESSSVGVTTSSVLMTTTQSLAKQARKYALLLLAGLTVLALLILLMIGSTVQESMQHLTEDSLRSMLAAHVNALEMWLTESEANVQQVLQRENVEPAAKELLDKQAAFAGEWTIAAAQAETAYTTLANGLQNVSPLGWALLDNAGKVVACEHTELIGQRFAIAPEAMQALVATQSSISRPFRLPLPISAAGPLSRAGAPIMCALAPVVDGARTVGSLAIMIDPLDHFTGLLAVARTGDTGETYAFDRSGTLLSQSRFEDQLRAVSLLDADPLIASPLNVSVRDPGTNLVSGGKPQLDRSEQPLTVMADLATRGGTGANVTGYNDYRGVRVVGAWTWIPQYGIGVATEMDLEEAYRPITLLKRAWLILLSIVGLGFGSLVVLTSLIKPLGRLQSATPSVRRLGQYELGEILGRGGMGCVYRGRHQLLRRDVAIKVLEAAELSPQTSTRFEREVQMTSQLRHPNTIDIYDYGRADDGTFFYVMELVEGISLQELIDQYGRQPPGRVIHLMLQICGSLSEAHQLGLIHRDVKPSNILLSASAGLYDVIKVLDFGLVKALVSDSQESAIHDLTTTDGITGTPMYMSPEAVRDAGTADQRSDLYSVGAVGFLLLAGAPLFEDGPAVDVCLKQLSEQPVRPSERIGEALPEDLQNVLMSCLRKDPEERPLSIVDLEEALRHCHDAGTWSTADAVRWWEVDFVPVSSPSDDDTPRT